MNDIIDQMFAADAISVFGQVLLINVVLSGDNAIVVGMAAAGLPARERRRALWLGIAVATALRVVFAVVATNLLHILGLALAGGVLLLWVAWKLWREVRDARHREAAAAEARREGRGVAEGGHTKTFGKALSQIVLADVSMSLDNALAVAGVAIEHPMILIVGLAISVLLMGAAATVLARLLERHRCIAYVGLIVIVYVALKMIWTGAHDVLRVVA
jgi:YjbE family integral membrane protein